MAFIKSFTDENNIEVKLYTNNAGKACVRGYDLDAGEVITITVYPSMDKAETAYTKLEGLMARA